MPNPGGFEVAGVERSVQMTEPGRITLVLSEPNLVAVEFDERRFDRLEWSAQQELWVRFTKSRAVMTYSRYRTPGNSQPRLAIRYYTTIVTGNALDEFAEETEQIVDYVSEQQVGAAEG